MQTIKINIKLKASLEGMQKGKLISKEINKAKLFLEF